MNYAAKIRFPVLIIALLFTLLSGSALAQLTTATVVGTVTDSTGAAIPGATVTLTQIETEFKRTVMTKLDGTFRDEFLPIGPTKSLLQPTDSKPSNGAVSSFLCSSRPS